MRQNSLKVTSRCFLSILHAANLVSRLFPFVHIRCLPPSCPRFGWPGKLLLIYYYISYFNIRGVTLHIIWSNQHIIIPSDGFSYSYIILWSMQQDRFVDIWYEYSMHKFLTISLRDDLMHETFNQTSICMRSFCETFTAFIFIWIEFTSIFIATKSSHRHIWYNICTPKLMSYNWHLIKT